MGRDQVRERTSQEIAQRLWSKETCEGAIETNSARLYKVGHHNYMLSGEETFISIKELQVGHAQWMRGITKQPRNILQEKELVLTIWYDHWKTTPPPLPYRRRNHSWNPVKQNAAWGKLRRSWTQQPFHIKPQAEKNREGGRSFHVSKHWSFDYYYMEL